MSTSDKTVSVRKVQLLIALLSAVLFVGKMAAWLLTHSVTILTDALESTVNVAAGFIGLYTLRIAAKPRDADHPYGHAKAELISAAIEGVLVLVAGVLVLYGAAVQLFRPQAIHSLDTGMIVVAVAGALNYAAGVYAKRQGRRHHSLVVQSAGVHLRSDAYSSAGALLGLLLIYITGWGWLDSVVAAIFATFILRAGYRVVRASFAGIMDEADVPLLSQILRVIEAARRPRWIDLHNLRVVQYGDKVHLDAHMTLPWYDTVQEADAEIQALEQVVKKDFGASAELFIHIDACQPYQCKLCTVAPCPVRQEPFQKQIPWTLETVWEDAKHGKGSTEEGS